MGRLQNKLSPADDAVLRRLLNLGDVQSYPRCPGKSRHRIDLLHKKGDLSHDAKNHLCDDCRCQNVAGAGTKGDYYKIDRPELGHYGTGYCAVCAKRKRRDTVDREWKEHLRTLQQNNKPVTDVQEFARDAEVGAAKATANLEVMEALEQVRGLMTEINDLHSNDQLTERGKDGPQPMSDGTRIDLELKRIRLLNELGKTKFEIDRELHIPIDVMKIWIVDVMNIFGQIAPTKDDYDKACVELQKAITKTRNPNLMIAGTKVKAESLPKKAEVIDG